MMLLNDLKACDFLDRSTGYGLTAYPRSRCSKMSTNFYIGHHCLYTRCKAHLLVSFKDRYGNQVIREISKTELSLLIITEKLKSNA